VRDKDSAGGAGGDVEEDDRGAQPPDNKLDTTLSVPYDAKKCSRSTQTQ